MSSSWLGKILPSVGRSSTKKTEVPEGLWKKCAKCGAFLYRPELEKNQDVCPKCDHHMRINARRRLDLFLDAEGREELAAELENLWICSCMPWWFDKNLSSRSWVASLSWRPPQ